MTACARCGEGNSDGARFCQSCGATLSPMVSRGHERKLATVLFADLAGSTGLGERLDPEHVGEVMQTYFAAMRAEIEAEGGSVEKFIGDAVVAAFGVPVAHEDDAERALRAALRMQRALGAVNASLMSSHGLALEMRIGVNTGLVLAVSEPRAGEPMATGDVMNVAARLQQAAEPGSVLVAERTARATRGFLFEEVGEATLRGKQAPVHALRLMGVASSRVQRGISGMRAAMVGRDGEMSLMRSVFERVAAERRPYLVTLYGEAGVGKSRLASEFLTSLAASGPAPRFTCGRCLPYGVGITYWPLAEMLKGEAGVLDTDPPGAALEKVRAWGRAVLTREFTDDPARTTAALAYTVGLEDPEHDLRALSPRQVRAETLMAWRSFFSALTAGGTLVALIEDIHWADPTLLDLLEDLADRVEGPALLLCTSRPQLTAQRPAWGGGRRRASSVLLDPLSPADADALVRALLELERLPDSVHRRIVARAEGNPFFLEEILRKLLDERGIVRGPAGWEAASSLETMMIPDTVQAVLAARIDLLERVPKRVLQMAAVVGRTFWSGAVERLLEGEQVDLDDALDTLEERELVRSQLSSSMEGQREAVFEHVLTRDVAYESLPRRDRARAHAAAAAWIETTAGERSAEFVELLADHYAEALSYAADAHLGPDHVEQLRASAFGHLVAAADQANTKLVSEKAVRLGEQARELASGAGERARALEVLGNAAFNDFRGDDAWAHFRAAADELIAAAPDERLRIAHLCARALEIPVRHAGLMTRLNAFTRDDAARYLQVGFDCAGDSDSEALVRLLTIDCAWLRGRERHADAELDTKVETGERAAAMAMRLHRPDLASAALDAVGGCHLDRGRYGLLRDTVARRLELAPLINDRWELGDIYNMEAWGSFMVGRYTDSIRASEEALRLLAGENAVIAVQVLPWLVLAGERVGDWSRCLDDFAASVQLLGELRERPPPFATRHLGAAALIHEIRGDSVEADRILGVALGAHDRALSVAPTRGWLQSYHAHVLARRGQLDQARRLLELPARTGSQGLVQAALCDVVAMQQDWPSASGVAERAHTLAEGSGLLALTAHATRLEGRAALARGDNAAAAALLARARSVFAELGARWEAACTDLSLAPATGGDAAREGLASALETFEALGSVREIELARQALGALTRAG